MPQNRYYFPEQFIEDETVILTDDEFHYLSHVMRLKTSQEVELINGKGELAIGHITTLSKKEATVCVSKVTKQNPLPFSLRLLLAYLKPAHLEYALEKATELGVTSFCLFNASRSEKKAVSDQYLKRLQTIVLSASKQCGRLYLPDIVIKDRLKDCLDESLTIFGDLEGSLSLSKQPLQANVTLAIGPEAGFTPQERFELIEHGAKDILLHANTLRAETAAVIGIGLLFDKLSTSLSI